MNLAQLATWKQARDLVAQIAMSPYAGMGGGVRQPVSDRLEDQSRSGVYRPLWNAQPFSPEPYWKDVATGEEYFFLHLRFNNGGEGMNVGLMLDKFKRYPMSPLYVLGALAQEADSLPRP